MVWNIVILVTVGLGLWLLYKYVMAERDMLLKVTKAAVDAWGSVNDVIDPDKNVIDKNEKLQKMCEVAVEAVEQMSTIDATLVNAPAEEKARLKKEAAMQAVRDLAVTGNMEITEADLKTVSWLIEAAVSGINFLEKKLGPKN